MRLAEVNDVDAVPTRLKTPSENSSRHEFQIRETLNRVKNQAGQGKKSGRAETENIDKCTFVRR